MVYRRGPKALLPLLALAGFWANLACEGSSPTENGGGGGGSGVVRIEISPPSGEVVEGQSMTFTCRGVDSNGGTRSITVEWRVESEVIASITQAGSVTGLSPGTTRVAAVYVGGAAPLSATANLTVTPRQPASVTVTPDTREMVAGETAEFQARVKDQAGQLLPDAVVTWESGDASILSVQASTGVVLALQPGQTTVSARAGTANGTAVVTVRNQLPAVTIQAPGDGGAFGEGTAVAFQGSAVDPEDGIIGSAALNWFSNISGLLGTGSGLVLSDLPLGSHTITLEATDSDGGLGSASVGIQIISDNDPPNVTLTSPSNGATYVEGEAVSFEGSGTDPEDGALPDQNLTWASSRDGALGTGTAFTRSDLSVGTHTITLTAKDSKGATAVKSVQIEITGFKDPPTVEISGPASGSQYLVGDQVTFTGTGTDPEDGNLPGASLVWHSSINGGLGTGETYHTTGLSAGTHTITLTGTGSGGKSDTDQVSITVGTPNQAPTANISSPADGSTHGAGTSVTFSGTGSDAEDGTLTGASLVWTSSLDGQIGTGTSFSLASLSEGDHTITLTATDSGGLTGMDQVDITIAPVVTHTLTVNKTGTGTVGSNDGGISIAEGGTTDQASYADGTTVTLTATPSSGWQIKTWGGACSGNASTCQVTMDADKTVSVEFEETNTTPIPTITVINRSSTTITLGQSFDLTVSVKNDGATSNMGGISVSFPALNASGDDAQVEVAGGTSADLSTALYPQGSAINNSLDTQMYASYLLAEAQDSNWSGGEVNSLVLRVTPTATGTFWIYLRAWMRGPDGTWYRDPSSAGGTDQQGYRVYAVSVTVEAPSQPDLIRSNVAASVTAAVGGNITISSDITNAGGADATSFELGFYLSTNTIISTSDRRIAYCTWDVLAAGDSDTCYGTVTVPSDMSPGAYYLGVIADDQNTVVESDESNNKDIAPYSTVITGGVTDPDLIIQSVSAPSTGVAGGNISVSVVTANQGGADAGEFRVGVYLSTNDFISTGDTRLAYCLRSSLAAGESFTCSGEVGIPSDMGAGTFWVGALADYEDLVAEADESNNRGTAPNSTVISTPSGVAAQGVPGVPFRVIPRPGGGSRGGSTRRETSHSRGWRVGRPPPLPPPPSGATLSVSKKKGP